MLRRVKDLIFLKPRTIQSSSNLMVVISGCDSGLGFQLARAAYDRGLTVVAGLLQGPQQEAGLKLSRMCPNIHLLPLDITKDDSVYNFNEYVQRLLKNNPNYVLHGLVNNAGVMVMGEFEWQPQHMLEQQINVNVLGTWRLTKAMLPALRQAATIGASPRVITVGSHCGQQALRTLGPYSASKAALFSWTEALRMELRYYGIYVVNYIPGNMTNSTSLLSEQKKRCEDMKSSMNNEQMRYYGKYFDNFVSAITAVNVEEKNAKNVDKIIVDTFFSALLEAKPAAQYKNEPWRYTMYYNLFNMSPRFVRYWLIDKFLLLPTYEHKDKLL